MRVPLAALLLLGALLAGCESGPSAPAEVVFQSKPTEEVRSNATAPGAFQELGKTRGHIAGVVVDEAIRPIEGATVKLPGLDLVRQTDRDGSFGFVDLYPGPYFIEVEAEGYYAAEAVLEVKEDEFTRAKVILAPMPPPEPYRVMQSFDGFTDLTTDPILGYAVLCSQCDFDFYVDRPQLRRVIIEAAYENHVEGDGFWHSLYPYESSSYEDRLSDGTTGDPLRIEIKDKDLGDADRFKLRLDPESFPAPSTSRRFTVFVTAFYNEDPPTGWSFVAGDP